MAELVLLRRETVVIKVGVWRDASLFCALNYAFRNMLFEMCSLQRSDNEW